jgi:hypothetical protein
MIRKLTLACVVVFALLTGGCIQASQTFKFTRPWGDYDRVVVRTANGHVNLTSGHTDQLRVAGHSYVQDATYGAAAADLRALEVVAQPDEQHPRTLQIAVHVPDALRHKSWGVDLEIGLPTACAAEITTSNGSIYVADAADCVLKTSNASVEVERIAGGVDATTSNGRVKALCVAGDLTARTSNDPIQVENVQGACRLATSNAPIKVLAAGGNVEASTSNDSIRFEAIGAEHPKTGATVSLCTSNGPITLLLSRQFAGELSLATSNGPIQASLLNIAAEIHRQTPDELRATLNGGGPASVTAETSNGAIRVDFR